MVNMSDSRLSEALAALNEAVLAVDREALALRRTDEKVSADEVADAVTAVHASRDLLKGTFDTLCQVIEPLIGNDNEMRAPSGVLIERKWSKPRKAWRHQDLAAIVAHRIRSLAIDPDTGEVLMSPEEQIVALMRYAAPSYWRVKELQALGIDADGYCETGESTPSIVVRPNA